MDVGELPMILFTVIAQMCVGAFLTLGVIQTLATPRFSAKVVDKIADPALYAIGPAMVAGLLVSMLHMHNPLNMFNVIRHFDSSWLSREIVFGVAFAGFGFLFALLQWRKIGSPRVRQVVAGITALLGIGLVVSMSMIYYSLTTVPAWNHWATPVGFFLTAVILGSLAVGAALMIATRWREGHGATADPEADKAIAVSLRGIAVTAVVAGAVSLVRIPLYVADLASQGGAALESAAIISGPTLAVRLVLLAIGTALMGVFIYFFATRTDAKAMKPLAVVTVAAFLIALVAELVGRSLFYQAMVRMGV